MKNESGQTTVEWILLAGVVLIGMAFALHGYENTIANWYFNASKKVASAGVKQQ